MGSRSVEDGRSTRCNDRERLGPWPPSLRSLMLELNGQISLARRRHDHHVTTTRSGARSYHPDRQAKDAPLSTYHGDSASLPSVQPTSALGVRSARCGSVSSSRRSAGLPRLMSRAIGGRSGYRTTPRRHGLARRTCSHIQSRKAIMEATVASSCAPVGSRRGSRYVRCGIPLHPFARAPRFHMRTLARVADILHGRGLSLPARSDLAADDHQRVIRPDSRNAVGRDRVPAPLEPISGRDRGFFRAARYIAARMPAVGLITSNAGLQGASTSPRAASRIVGDAAESLEIHE